MHFRHSLMKMVARQNRRAISELIGSLLMIAMTLVAGTILYGFVYNQLGLSTNQIGGEVGKNVNSLQERMTVVYAEFPNSTRNQLSLWVYNSGNIVLNITDVWVIGANSTVIFERNLVYWRNSTLGCGSTAEANTVNESPILNTSIPIGAIKGFVFSVPSDSQCPVTFPWATSFTIQVQGYYGYVASTSRTKGVFKGT